MSPAPGAVAAAILALVAARGAGRSACPSEVARALSPDWRALMPLVRAEAARLGAEGRIRVTQRGRTVDPAGARGPVRLALPAPD